MRKRPFGECPRSSSQTRRSVKELRPVGPTGQCFTAYLDGLLHGFGSTASAVSAIARMLVRLPAALAQRLEATQHRQHQPSQVRRGRRRVDVARALRAPRCTPTRRRPGRGRSARSDRRRPAPAPSSAAPFAIRQPRRSRSAMSASAMARTWPPSRRYALSSGPSSGCRSRRPLRHSTRRRRAGRALLVAESAIQAPLPRPVAAATSSTLVPAKPCYQNRSRAELKTAVSSKLRGLADETRLPILDYSSRTAYVLDVTVKNSEGIVNMENRTAVVTGGTTGIGLAMAKRFVAEGAEVFITGRRRNPRRRGRRHRRWRDGRSDRLGRPGRSGRALPRRSERGRGKWTSWWSTPVAVARAARAKSPRSSSTRRSTPMSRGMLFTVQKALPLLNENASMIVTGSTASTRVDRGRQCLWGDEGGGSQLRSQLDDRAEGDRDVRVNVLSPGPP